MDTDTIYTLHLFAGAGGGILGDLLLGHVPVGAVEIEAYPRKVLLARQLDGSIPRFPIWDDVCTFRSDNPDTSAYIERLRGIRERLCICGGSPCKGISSARTNNPTTGRPGIDGGSSQLFFEYTRIIGEIQPRFCLWENTPTITTQGLDKVLCAFDAMGYDTRRGVLECKSDGADHERDRMFVVAYTNGAQREGGKLPCGTHTQHQDACGTDWWTHQPDMERVAYGVACWVDRLKAIGNGQVPQVVRLAWEVLNAI